MVICRRHFLLEIKSFIPEDRVTEADIGMGSLAGVFRLDTLYVTTESSDETCLFRDLIKTLVLKDFIDEVS
jgi:membrane protein YdbS with pleckstrin-like domain